MGGRSFDFWPQGPSSVGRESLLLLSLSPRADFGPGAATAVSRRTRTSSVAPRWCGRPPSLPSSLLAGLPGSCVQPLHPLSPAPIDFSSLLSLLAPEQEAFPRPSMWIGNVLGVWGFS